MDTLTFKHGPVTITVTGLPDTIDPRSIDLGLHLHSPWYPDPHAAFVANFLALGGTGTFPDADPEDRSSPRHDVVTDERTRSTLYLHVPEDRVQTGNEAITAAIDAETKR